MLIAGSSNCSSGKLTTTIRITHNFNHIIIITPRAARDNVDRTVAVCGPLCLHYIQGRRKLRICTFSNAPISYIGVTFSCLLHRRHISLMVSNVGRNSGSTIGILCSKAVNTTVRNDFCNYPTIKLSLSSRNRSTSFRTTITCNEQVINDILRGEVRLPLYLGIGIPINEPSRLHNVHLYHRGHNF